MQSMYDSHTGSNSAAQAGGMQHVDIQATLSLCGIDFDFVSGHLSQM